MLWSFSNSSYVLEYSELLDSINSFPYLITITDSPLVICNDHRNHFEHQVHYLHVSWVHPYIIKPLVSHSGIISVSIQALKIQILDKKN